MFPIFVDLSGLLGLCTTLWGAAVGSLFLSLSLSVLVLRLTSGCLEVLCGSIDPGEKIIMYKLE